MLAVGIGLSVMLSLSHTIAESVRPSAPVGLSLDSLVCKPGGGAEVECRPGYKLDADVAGLRIEKKNGVGFVSIDSPLVPVQPGQAYKVTVRFHTERPAFNSLAYLMVREYEAADRRPLLPYHTTHAEFRPVLPCRPGEWIPRYATCTTGPQTTLVNVSLVLSGNPTALVIGEVKIEPATDEKRPAGPRSQDNLADLEQTMERLRALPRAEARLRRLPRRVELLINHEPSPPVVHQRVYWDSRESLHGLFAEAGVRVHVVPVKLGPYDFDGEKIHPGIWIGHEQYDFRRADADLQRALRVDPDLKIIVGLTLTPYPGWGDRHPDEVAQNERGERAVGSFVHNIAYRNERLDSEKEFWCPTLSSEVYRRETLAAALAWLDHLKATPMYNAVIGFMLYGGDDGQWQNWARSGALNMADYSPAARRAFQRWLRARHGSTAKLRAAWNRDDIGFDSAPVPGVAARLAADRVFLNPATDRAVMDYRQFETEEVARTVDFFARGLKRAAGKPVICGSYYEDAWYGRFNTAWAQRILRESDHMDFFASPLDYGPYRRPGWGGGVSAALSSLSLHGKLFLQELDLRTAVSRYSSDPYDYFTIGRLETAADFRAVNLRETGVMAAYGMGQWYYSMAGGSFYAPYAPAEIARAAQLHRRIIAAPPSSFRPDVAVFADEASGGVVSQAHFQRVVFPSTSQTRPAVFFSGVPADLYDMADLMHPRRPDYRIYVFLHSYRLDARQRAFIERKLKRDGRTLVWMHAAGYADESGLSLANLERTVGMKVRLDPTVQKLDVAAVPDLPERYRGLLPVQGVASDAIASVKFSVDDPAAVVLGRYVEGGEPAIAIKRHPRWTSVYVAAPGGLGPDLLNRVAADAGAYTVCDFGNLVAFDGNLLVLHGVLGGERTITLPFRADVVDLVSQQTVARNAKDFSLSLSVKDTRLFALVQKEMK